jgi:hypothetical protein
MDSEYDSEKDEDEENPLAEIQREIDAMDERRRPVSEPEMVDDDKPDIPEEMQKAIIQYQIQPEISKKLKKQFDPNVFITGTHVVNSNTKRVDNLRHLGEFDSTLILRNYIPYLRGRATDTKIRTTGEFQMCRSNQEIGGFDRKMQYTNIRRDSVDVNQKQSITQTGKMKKGGILSTLNPFRKKKEQ